MKAEVSSFLAGQVLAQKGSNLQAEVQQKSEQFSSMVEELKAKFDSPEMDARIDAWAAETKQAYSDQLAADIQPALEALQSNLALAQGYAYGNENIATQGSAFVSENVEALKAAMPEKMI